MKPVRRLGSGPVYELSEAAIAFWCLIGFNKFIDKLLSQILHILRTLRANNTSLNRLNFIEG
ncbi:hypothetical protein NG799_07725 [Laspinema sp. D1]|uniref:Transposase n=1 Tax=Laspinema palackyanum D2a TaxID=2953684 RepID=A0ABT2MNA6_9CYAN|nr:hypothetical protein [Laspinema sp. D2a]